MKIVLVHTDVHFNKIIILLNKNILNRLNKESKIGIKKYVQKIDQMRQKKEANPINRKIGNSFFLQLKPSSKMRNNKLLILQKPKAW